MGISNQPEAGTMTFGSQGRISTQISDGYGDYMDDAFVRASDRLSLNRLGIITEHAH